MSEQVEASDGRAKDGRTIEERVNLSLAVGRFVRAQGRHQAALKECQDAFEKMCCQIGPNDRVVVKNDFTHYLVQSDSAGKVTVELIDYL